jgi:hypothetical protein
VSTEISNTVNCFSKTQHPTQVAPPKFTLLALNPWRPWHRGWGTVGEHVPACALSANTRLAVPLSISPSIFIMSHPSGQPLIKIESAGSVIGTGDNHGQ